MCATPKKTVSYLSLVHTSRRSYQLLQRARLQQIIGNFSILTATVAGRSRFAATLNEPLHRDHVLSNTFPLAS